MGIKSLSQFLKKSHPELFKPIHISEFAYKKVAIDISLYLCNYKALYGDGGWLSAFVRLVACLRENEIHPIFIYDGGFPAEKKNEQKERADSREKMEDRVSTLEEAIDKFENTGELDQCLLDFQKKRKIQPLKSLLSSGETVNIKGISYMVEKMRKQLFHISKEDFETTKKLFKILDVPYIDAPLEAETTCADLAKMGKVDAVLSEDTDLLAYGAPIFLSKINTSEGTCIRIDYDELLESMEMDSEQFLDFCIMCGTDYNKNIFKVGPAKSYSLIKKYGSIEGVAESGIDISILNHIRVRELFRDYKRVNCKISYCGIPNFEALTQFIFKKNIKIDIERLRKVFVKEIEIIEDQEEINIEDD